LIFMDFHADSHQTFVKILETNDVPYCEFP